MSLLYVWRKNSTAIIKAVLHKALRDLVSPSLVFHHI